MLKDDLYADSACALKCWRCVNGRATFPIRDRPLEAYRSNSLGITTLPAKATDATAQFLGHQRALKRCECFGRCAFLFATALPTSALMVSALLNWKVVLRQLHRNPNRCAAVPLASALTFATVRCRAFLNQYHGWAVGVFVFIVRAVQCDWRRARLYDGLHFSMWHAVLKRAAFTRQRMC